MVALERFASVRPSSVDVRPEVRGKFLFVGGDKLYVRGVTYGTFEPDVYGNEFHDPDVVERDFGLMAANGINAIRTYTTPPRWLLDCARRHGLRVMVGLAWEQHIAFLDDRKRPGDIEARIRAAVRTCAQHPAILCYVIGNEIPSSIVRWHGARRVERFLDRLYRAVKEEDPDGLVTYVNYPSTEYLDLRFVDLVCFNVYLETQDKLQAYLARLQNIAGDRPLIMAEVGLDSRSHGLSRQADTLAWQLRTAFTAGCAGIFVFAWTDEWFRGGYPIEDWDFGLTDRQRNPKPALGVVRATFDECPFPRSGPWPRISIVVCSCNGERTLADCCQGLCELDYPNFEVIVVDDGSTDATARIAREYGLRVVSTANRGLSNARNTGLAVATGDIVAYIDDDVRPDPQWLHYLAITFMTTDHAGVGGPNIAPAGDGPIADCVANAPGGPVHVLLSDEIAEHIPGCNMAFRRDALEAIGGFDPRFRVAGDDVDICWRLQAKGWTLGISPAAMVWHHRRNSVRAYWRQQKGYGRAEARLERKWPEKYNAVGHVSWGGRMYGRGINVPLLWSRRRVYHGEWGSALFQSVYQPAPGIVSSIPLMPEWYLVILALAGLSLLALVWPVAIVALPVLGLCLGATVWQSALGGKNAAFSDTSRSRSRTLSLCALTAFLHLIQPWARLWGRLRSGLTPWRRRGAGLRFPWARSFTTWRAYILSAEGWLAALESTLQSRSAAVRRGGPYDRWDLQIRGGALGAARIRMVIEDHGASKQLIRFRLWPIVRLPAVALVVLCVTVAGITTLTGAVLTFWIITTAAFLILLRTIWECALALGTAVAPFARGGMEADIPFRCPDARLEWRRGEEPAALIEAHAQTRQTNNEPSRYETQLRERSDVTRSHPQSNG